MNITYDRKEICIFSQNFLQSFIITKSVDLSHFEKTLINDSGACHRLN